MEKLLIIDSNSILNRAYFALPPMVTQDGQHTNAIYGYLNMLLKIKEELDPDFIVATFDRKAPTFRHQQYDNYKAGRKGMDDELAQQLAPMKEILDAMSISILEIDGYEADDLIGTLSLEAEKRGIETYILSGDKDNLQLASALTRVVITKKGITDKAIYDADAFFAEYGITPTQFIDMKGLMGDKSDNIPGVPGIGEKTALQLIRDFGSMEGVYENLEAITRPKQKQNLIDHMEDAFFSKKLATIMRDVPVDIDFEALRDQNGYDVDKLRELYLRFQFRTLLAKLGRETVPTDPQPAGVLPTDPPAADSGEAPVQASLFDDAPPRAVFSDALEIIRVEDAAGMARLRQSVERDLTRPLLLSFAYREDLMLSRREIETIYACIGGEYYCLAFQALLTSPEAMTQLARVLEGNDVRRIGYNVKNAYTILKKHGIRFEQVEMDVQIAAYLLEPARGQYSLKDLIAVYLQREIEGSDEASQLRRTAQLEELAGVLASAITDAGAGELLYEVEQPLTNILSDMEIEGFRINRTLLDEVGVKLQQEIARTQGEIYDLAGETFNIASPKQLGVILFDKLDLPHGKKTKTGYSTNQAVLDTLLDKHPIVEKVLYYRQITKIYSTYVEGLRNAIDTDGRIHSNFQQTLAVTGRLSSTEPNLQNIPIRYEMGRELRKAFIPHDEDSLIFSSDYSQIELRILAHLADDEKMQEAFASGIDIHTKTAAEVFGKTPAEVTPQDRSNAKAVNFGIIYGIGDFALSQGLGISRAEARSYIDMYYDRYPKIRSYFDRVMAQARATGFVTTILNRRRQIPEINASNKVVQALGVRLAMNSPIQGSAADLIKLAMVRVSQALKAEGLASRMILQVHDEIIINLKKDEEARVRELVAREMTHCMDLKVELKSDQNTGGNWYEAK